MSGPSGVGLDASGGAFTVYGSNFTYNNQPNYFGPLSSGTGSFSGLLADNSTLETVTFTIANSGSITLAPAPVPASEPSQMTVFALAGAGLLGLSLRARKRAAFSA